MFHVKPGKARCCFVTSVQLFAVLRMLDTMMLRCLWTRTENSLLGSNFGYVTIYQSRDASRRYRRFT